MSAANNTPVYQQKPILGAGLTPGTADTSTTAPTNTTKLATGAADGTRIREIVSIVNATTASACIVRLFTRASSAGAFTFYDEIFFEATTITTTTLARRRTKPLGECVLPSGVELHATVTDAVGAGKISLTAHGWDYTP